MDQFQIILQAILEKTGVEKSLKDVQTLAKQLPIEMTAKLNATSTRNDFKKVANEMAHDLNKLFDFNLTGKDVMSAYNQMIIGAEKVAKAQETLSSQITKAVSKVKELQSTGKITLDYSAVDKSYQSLEKVGAISDKLKADFTQLKVFHDALGNSATDEELVQNYTKFNTALNTVNNSLKQVKISELSSLKTAQTQVDFDSKRQLTVQKISTYLAQNSKLLAESKKGTSANHEEARKWYDEIIRIKNALSGLDTNDLTNQNQYKILNQQLSTAKSKVKEFGLEGRSATDEFKNMFEKFSGWFGVSQAVMFGLNKFKDAIAEIKEIDTTLTEISKTANVTAKQLAKIGDNSFESASEYGVKANTYLLGVQEMSRAGYENSEKMAELATLAVSAGDMSADLANDYLIASDAAYKYGGDIEKLTALLDGQNQITNRNAVSMEELANATKVAGSMLSNVADIKENELSALLGTGIATSRESGETVARAVKSIVMNLQGVAGEGGFDGEIIDEEQLEKVESRCHSVGVELEYMKDGIVSLRNPMKIFGELADVYNSLPKDSAERAGIISDIGGKYRANVLSSILSNYDKVEKMMGDYENSSGSAMNEAIKSANNFEGSLNRLSNTWTDTIENIVDSKGLTTTVNGFNGILDIINKLTSALGGLGTAAAIGGGILGAKNIGKSIQSVWFQILF